MPQPGVETARSVNLARVPPFRLGEVEVHPATRQLRRGAKRETLEPRVMQVLVALADAQGQVLSREELIERCWGGRIVGDNAINRVISRIRQISADFGMDSFQLETITKVGYRMLVFGASPADACREAASPVASPDREAPPCSTAGAGTRRSFVAAAVATVALSGTAAWLWIGEWPHRPPPAAAELFRRGQEAQRQGEPEQVRQAVSFFKQAVAIDPLFADAWGALALAYHQVWDGFADTIMGGGLAGGPHLIEAAARRALNLDPENFDGRLGLALARPHFRHWSRNGRALQDLERQRPEHWLLQGQLGLLLYQVGRWRDGLVHTDRLLSVDRFLPAAHLHRARALWSCGRLQEADAQLDAALDLWPAHFALWNFKYGLLLMTGRPASAEAFVMEPETRPERLGPESLRLRVMLARAVATRAPAEVSASLALLRGRLDRLLHDMVLAAPVFVQLGAIDLALAALETYYLGAKPGNPLGSSLAPPGPGDQRYTQFLFTPDMAPLWQLERFRRLLRAIGLEDHWRTSGRGPDFRRGTTMRP